MGGLCSEKNPPRTGKVALRLDRQVAAAAGTVVGAQDQHHILVANGAAQGFFIPYQGHGVDGVQTFDQTLRVILSLIEGHKTHHSLKDTGAERIRVSLPSSCQHGQSFFVEVCAIGLVLLEGGAEQMIFHGAR